MIERSLDEWVKFLGLTVEDEKKDEHTMRLEELVDELNRLDMWHFGDDVDRRSAIVGAAIMLLAINDSDAVMDIDDESKKVGIVIRFFEEGEVMSRHMSLEECLYWTKTYPSHITEAEQLREIRKIANELEKIAKRLRATKPKPRRERDGVR